MTAFRRNWGFAIFTVLSAYGLMRLLGQPIPGHYRVFTGAARALAEGRNPYGTDFGTGVGDYFYSPACALYFFRAFAGLSEKVGLALYMILSWAVFVVGARRALAAFSRSAWPEGPPAELAQLFWLGVGPQVFGGILASKLEIIMTGILFFSVAWVAEKRWLLRSALLSALITNWKFQPLPIMGLLGVAWLSGASGETWRRRLCWPLGFTAGLLFWYLLPYAEVPAQLLAQAQDTWVETFSAFVRDSYLNFENVFVLLQHGLGIAISYRVSQFLTAGVGLLLVANLIAWIRWVHPEPAWSWVVLLAVGSGTMVMTAFSPLGQNNALVLYSPLFLAALLRIGTARRPRVGLGFLALIWVVMAFSYSDMTPIVIREQLRYDAAKAGACIILGAVWIASLWRVEWMRMLNEKRKTGLKLFCGLFAAFMLISLTHCGSSGSMASISQDQIFPQYALNYDDASKGIIASAVFTQGNALGPRLTLTEGASIALSDGTQFRQVVSQPDQHIFYQANLGSGTALDSSKQFVFVFRDSSGDEYRNSLSFGGTIDVDATSFTNPHSLSTDADVNYIVSQNLRPGERVQVRLRQDGGKGSVVLHEETTPAFTPNSAPALSSQAKIMAAELKPLSPGPALVRICRIIDGTPPQHAKAGGQTTVSSCSAEAPVTLSP